MVSDPGAGPVLVGSVRSDVDLIRLNSPADRPTAVPGVGLGLGVGEGLGVGLALGLGTGTGPKALAPANNERGADESARTIGVSK